MHLLKVDGGVQQNDSLADGQVLAIDHDAHTVTVEGGCVYRSLIEELEGIASAGYCRSAAPPSHLSRPFNRNPREGVSRI